MNTLQAWVAQLELDNLWIMLVTVASAVLCITFHETCHGLMAYALGDDTAKRAGRLSLNPLKHIDFFGLVMLAVAKFGWAKPVPIHMGRFRNPKVGMAVCALAGPLGNVVLCAVSMVLYGICRYYSYESGGLYYLELFFWYTIILSAGLAVFNLFPVPPLDGSKILFAILPTQWYWKLMRYERYGMTLLMVLLLTGVLDAPLSLMRDWLLTALAPLALVPYELLAGI